MTRVRVATQYDEEPVLEVLRADGEVTGRQPSKARLAEVRGLLRSPGALTLVAEDDGRVIGVLVARLPEGRAGAGWPGAGRPGGFGSSPALELSLACVHPQSRRQGTASALVTALQERYPALTASTSDQAAAELMRSTGFRPVEGSPGHWVHP